MKDRLLELWDEFWFSFLPLCAIMCLLEILTIRGCFGH